MKKQTKPQADPALATPNRTEVRQPPDWAQAALGYLEALIEHVDQCAGLTRSLTDRDEMILWLAERAADEEMSNLPALDPDTRIELCLQ